MLDGRESRLSRSNREPRRRTERRENGVHESASRSFESAMRRRRRFRIRAVASAAAVTTAVAADALAADAVASTAVAPTDSAHRVHRYLVYE